MIVSDFYNEWIGRGNDIDKSYGLQCVDLYKQYCYEAYGTYTACPTGWADSYYTHYDYEPFIQEHFEKIENPADFRNGDWVFFSPDSGKSPWYLNHVTMYYNGQGFGTNQYGHNDVACLYDYDFNTAIGALRPIDGWDPEPEEEPESDLGAGTYQCVVDLVNVRTEPSTDAEIRAQYANGETVNILDVVHTNGYYWGHYVSYSGIDSYTALRTDDGEDYWELV